MSAPEVIATRHTADGFRVLAWSTGAVTDGAGYEVSRIRLERGALFVMLGDVCLYRWDELPALVRATARAARSGEGAAPERLRVAMRRAACGQSIRGPWVYSDIHFCPLSRSINRFRFCGCLRAGGAS